MSVYDDKQEVVALIKAYLLCDYRVYLHYNKTNDFYIKTRQYSEDMDYLRSFTRDDTDKEIWDRVNYIVETMINGEGHIKSSLEPFIPIMRKDENLT